MILVFDFAEFILRRQQKEKGENENEDEDENDDGVSYRSTAGGSAKEGMCDETRIRVTRRDDDRKAQDCSPVE